MMKYALLVAVCIIAASARPQNQVTIKEQVSSNDGNGNFKSRTLLSDGTLVEQTGSIKNPQAPPEEQIQVVTGKFSYVDPESGKILTVTYTADENGFQPQGAHLPVAPSARR